MLKGIHPLEDEYPYPNSSPINIRTLNASIGHSRKGDKPNSPAPHGGSRSSSHSYNEKLDNIMRCLDLHLSCTLTTSIVIRSSLLSKLYWTKSKES